MNLEPAPRLPKWPFILIDLVLLGTVFLLATLVKDPFAPVPFVSAMALVVLGVVAFAVPFLVDYARAQDRTARELHDAMEGQIKRLHAAGESLTRTAAHAKSIEEASQKTMHAAENLPYRMQEKLAEFNQQLEQAEDEEKENMTAELAALRQSEGEKLQGVADKVGKVVAEMTELEKNTRLQLSAAELRLQQLAAALDAAAGRHEKLSAELNRSISAQIAVFESAVAAAKAALAAVVAAPAAVVTPREPERPAPAPDSETPVPVRLPDIETPVATEPVVQDTLVTSDKQEISSAIVPHEAPQPKLVDGATTGASPTEEAVVSPAPVAPDPAAAAAHAPSPNPVAETAEQPTEPKPRKPRAPRRPKGEAPAVEAAGGSVEQPAAPPPPAEPTPEPNEDTLPLGTATESSASSDGATRLLATAYIGIGNKLFIRGAGPGLGWERGVPMQFISIGKWGWHTHEATAPVRCKLYKNDETVALGGEITLDPGRHVEVSAMF